MASEDVRLPVYLGPRLDRWLPESTDDVQTAIDDGMLAESRYLDVKRQMESTEGAKKELARDLASFANEGGALLIGVAEDKHTGKLTLNPVVLKGLQEQVDQVVRSRCDPPLYVECRPLNDPNDPTDRTGVLLVVVPQSPLAPHMVDYRYHGRGDTTKHKLNDREVERLHQARAARWQSAEEVIAREIERDPVPDSDFSHLHVVARPLVSRPDLLTSILEDRNQLLEIVRGVPRRWRQADQIHPGWGILGDLEPREHGMGYHVHELVGRQVRDQAKDSALLDIEVDYDGRVTLYCGRGSDLRRPNQFEEETAHVIFDEGITTHVRSTLVLAGDFAALVGYGGRWQISVGVTKLKGRRSSSGMNHYPDRRTPYSGNAYVETTEAVTSELLSRPGAVTKRLCSRLLRALGVSHMPGLAFEDQAGSSA